MAEMLLVNPRKRRTRRKASRTRAVAKRRTPVRTRRRRGLVKTKRRRNPAARRAGGIKGILKNTIIPSATAAGGALALDVAWGMLPIPENLKTGPVRHVAKAAGAIGIGMLAGMFTNATTASLIATGAMTVVMHNAGKEILGRVAPQLSLGEYEDELGYAGAGYNAGDIDELGMYVEGEDGLGMYVDGEDTGMGEFDEEEVEL